MITYMVSLASNEKTFLNYNFSIVTLLAFTSSTFLVFDLQKLGEVASLSLFVGPLYEVEGAQPLIFSFSMLLVALIRVVKLIKLEEGPLIKRL